MTDYYKLSGGGNDFIALVAPEADPTTDQIRAWCRRGISLGADGVIVLRRADGSVEMSHFNSDGGLSELCLNGTRCAAQLARHLGWATGRFRLLTGAGPVFARSVSASQVALELEAPAPSADPWDLQCGDRTVRGFYVEVGVPHFVVPWKESLQQAPVHDLGPLLRRHPKFPRGANVDFVRFPSPRSMEIRTYERGVEAETLACGTGVLAAVATGRALGSCELPVAAKTLGGFVIRVASIEEGSAKEDRWLMTGDARLVATGALLPGAEHQP